MNRYLFGSTAAGVLMLTLGVGAQAPAPGQPTTPAATADQAKAVTVEGCLKREADVPGGEPNVAERAGIGEDYLLTSAKVVKGDPPESAAGRSADKPTGTSGARTTMFKLEGLDDERLKGHVGHRVQIEGRFENVEAARSGSAGDKLVELRATEIRHISPTCEADEKK
jgi:hypothetical protein